MKLIGTSFTVFFVGITIGIVATIDYQLLKKDKRQAAVMASISLQECLKSCEGYAITTEQCKYQCQEKYERPK